MSVVAEVIAEATAAGIRFQVDGPGEITLRARQAPPAELVAKLRAHKPALLVMFGAVPSEVPQEWRDGVAKLQAMSSPEGVPAKAWHNLIANSASLLASPFATRAAMMGWPASGLWGCHARRPWQRIDCLGALWLLKDTEIVAITVDAITIRVKSGGRLTCKRPRPAPGEPVTLAWCLEDSEKGPPDPEAAA